MNITKLISTLSLTVAVITMMTSDQLSIYATPTTEDDGWTEGDYEGSPEEQEEQAQEDWEDAGRPGEDNSNDNDNDDDDNEDDNEEQAEETLTCPDGSVVSVNAACPSVLPYCDTDEGRVASSCFDREDMMILQDCIHVWMDHR